jgi:hypothetical protein
LDYWWGDLAPPFAIDTEGLAISSNVEEEENNMTNIIAEDDDPSIPRVTHFCFLVHGHRGLSRDLSYLQVVMQALAKQQIRTMRKKKNNSNFRHDMIVHNAVCNEGKTTDGVMKGGERLVEEMLQVMSDEMQKRNTTTSSSEHHVTVSVVGNSLGGLFGRYAVARLSEKLQQPDGSLLLNDTYPVHLNVFCTTATPHLGVSKYTFLPLPRTLEIGAAHAMGSTGRDL